MGSSDSRSCISKEQLVNHAEFKGVLNHSKRQRTQPIGWRLQYTRETKRNKIHTDIQSAA